MFCPIKFVCEIVTLRFRFVGDPLTSGMPSKTTRESLTFGVLRVNRVLLSSLNVVPSGVHSKYLSLS